jgi:hypothetical protein
MVCVYEKNMSHIINYVCLSGKFHVGELLYSAFFVFSFTSQCEHNCIKTEAASNEHNGNDVCIFGQNLMHQHV